MEESRRRGLVWVVMSLSLVGGLLGGRVGDLEGQELQQAGVFFGTDMPPWDSRFHRMGLVYSAPAFGIVEWYPGIEVFGTEMNGTRWHVLANLRARPRRSDGSRQPWYFGGGLVVRSNWFDPGILAGLEVPLANVRPFVELRFYGTEEFFLDAVVGMAVKAPGQRE